MSRALGVHGRYGCHVRTIPGRSFCFLAGIAGAGIDQHNGLRLPAASACCAGRRRRHHELLADQVDRFCSSHCAVRTDADNSWDHLRYSEGTSLVTAMHSITLHLVAMFYFHQVSHVSAISETSVQMHDADVRFSNSRSSQLVKRFGVGTE